MDPASELTELLQTERELVARPREQLRRGCRVVGKPRLGEAKAERERDQALLRAVVEVPLEPPPLGVAGLDDARARCGQLLAGLRVGERDGDEARELLEVRLDVGAELAPERSIEIEVEPQRRPETTIGAATPELTPAATICSWSVGRLVLQVDPRCSARLADLRDARRPAPGGARRAGRRRAGRLAASRRRSPPRPASPTYRTVARRRAEQPADLLRDGVEEPFRLLLVATATATRLSAACSSARVASSSRAWVFASATATRPANFPSRSSAFAANCRSRVTETTTAPQMSPDTTIGAATSGRHAERDQPPRGAPEARRGRSWPSEPARPSARPRPARRRGCR